MNRAENLDSIPTDLVLDILSRLPSKSVGRFHCVSKLWRSMLSSPYFTELYLTRSSASPRLLFAVYRSSDADMRFYSSPQPQLPYDKSSLVVAADYHTTFPRQPFVYASGLICFPRKCVLEEHVMPVICNPLTGQYAVLPKVAITYYKADVFLGFDPVEKQFKVLVEHLSYPKDRHTILTLGAPKLAWRSSIDCPNYYRACSDGIDISGVIYFKACAKSKMAVIFCFDVIICFDVRSEEIKVIRAECFNGQTPTLINCKGKLGGITWKSDESDAIELRMCVLDDVEKQEWSKYVYTLPENEDFNIHEFTIAGMTARGEIVFSKFYTLKPFYVFYFNPEKNTLRSVEILGVGDDLLRMVKVFVDHVEDFNFLR